MMTGKAMEYRITRQLIQRRQQGRRSGTATAVERLLTAAAVCAALLLMGTYLQELLWVGLGGSAVLTLGTGSD